MILARLGQVHLMAVAQKISFISVVVVRSQFSQTHLKPCQGGQFFAGMDASLVDAKTRAIDRADHHQVVGHVKILNRRARAIRFK